jgi:hypothetical protein
MGVDEWRREDPETNRLATGQPGGRLHGLRPPARGGRPVGRVGVPSANVTSNGHGDLASQERTVVANSHGSFARRPRGCGAPVRSDAPRPRSDRRIGLHGKPAHHLRGHMVPQWHGVDVTDPNDRRAHAGRGEHEFRHRSRSDRALRRGERHGPLRELQLGVRQWGLDERHRPGESRPPAVRLAGVPGDRRSCSVRGIWLRGARKPLLEPLDPSLGRDWPRPVERTRQPLCKGANSAAALPEEKWPTAPRSTS